MKKTLALFLAFSCIVMLCSNQLVTQQLPAEETSLWYKKALIDLKKSIEEFNNSIVKEDKENIALHYKHCRAIYKKVEFLFFYLNPHDVETYINGAPLPKLAIDTDLPDEIDAQGFQVIDELMAEIEAVDSKQAIMKQLSYLIERINRISLFQSGLILTDRQVYESMRQEIVTIATLGISGFDTPGTSSGLIDASVSLSQLKWCFELYENELKKAQFEQYDQTIELFELALQDLQLVTFESFDRFSFTKYFLIPLSSNILEAQEALDIEFRDEVDHLPTAVNQRAEHIFSRDFLNENYFIQRGGYAYNDDLKELGKTLFFDPILSSNNERACSSCHLPEKAFSESLSKSLAFNGEMELKRNAISLVNSVHTEKFFYDLRAGSLFTQFEHVIRNEGEFNTDYIKLEEKLSSCDEYVTLFNEAFGTNKDKVKKDQINIALATYIASLKGYDSEFDQMMRNEKPADKKVVNGYNLFMGKAMCGTCHFPPTFAGLRPPFYQESESEVIGVTKTEDLKHPELDDDLGRRLSGRPSDDMDIYNHSFKTLSVRNSDLSAPYFHNGSFTTLEKVLEFYNSGGGAGLGLDLPHQTLPFDSLSLTETEQQDIIHFLRSLTDIDGLTDKPRLLPSCQESQLSKRSLGGNY